MKLPVLTLLLCTIGLAAGAQTNSLKCGNEFAEQALRTSNPNYQAQREQTTQMLRNKLQQKKQPALKTTNAPYEIKVVFHVVLDSAKLQQLGGNAGIQERVTIQLAALNNDYLAQNADTASIPAPFKPFHGKMNIHFTLADKDPNGGATPGFEIKQTTHTGFDIQSGTQGSTFICSDAKYDVSGGLDAWDTKKYLNIWIINITPFGVGGAATPPPFPPFDIIPAAEQGVVLSYGAFGKRTSPSQYFLAPNAEEGRSLVHEVGHFFNLFHIWGESAGCGDDDGIGDTPLQADMTALVCPAFPKLDACTPAGDGVMYMNHMDYSCDTCRTMFTKEQVDMAHDQLAVGGYRHDLIVQDNPSAIHELAGVDQSFIIYPNPASGSVSIDATNLKGAKEFSLINNLGQVVKTIPAGNTLQPVPVDLSGLSTGIYYVQCITPAGISTRKLIVNN